MVKDPKGTRRKCLKCGVAFYDLNRKEIPCPKCGTIFKVSDFNQHIKDSAINVRDEVSTADENEIFEIFEDITELDNESDLFDPVPGVELDDDI